jgi:hypothetical protein
MLASEVVISIWQDGSFSYARMKVWIDAWTSFLSTFCVNPLANWLRSNSQYTHDSTTWPSPVDEYHSNYKDRSESVHIYLSRCKWKWASSPCSKWTICLAFAQEWESLCILLGPHLWKLNSQWNVQVFFFAMVQWDVVSRKCVVLHLIWWSSLRCTDEVTSVCGFILVNTAIAFPNNRALCRCYNIHLSLKRWFPNSGNRNWDKNKKG